MSEKTELHCERNIKKELNLHCERNIKKELNYTVSENKKKKITQIYYTAKPVQTDQ